MTSKLRPTRTPVPVPPDEDDLDLDGSGGSMTLLEHLEELRNRLFKAALGLVIGVIIGSLFASDVLRFLLQPYGAELVTLGPTDSVVVYFRVALLIGAIITIPWTTYQVLMFILPALTRKEKRTLLQALPAITLLFVVGVVFAWTLLIPPALNFFQDFQPGIFRPEWTGDRYISFVTTLLFWMGVAFETPLIFFVLALLGFVTARGLVQNWRIAIVGAAIAAALITPTIDPVNMGLVMGPLLALYVFSILLVALGRRISRVDAA